MRQINRRTHRSHDEPLLKSLYDHAQAQDLQLRFFTARREVPRGEIAHFSQIDQTAR